MHLPLLLLPEPGEVQVVVSPFLRPVFGREGEEEGPEEETPELVADACNDESEAVGGVVKIEAAAQTGDFHDT